MVQEALILVCSPHKGRQTFRSHSRFPMLALFFATWRSPLARVPLQTQTSEQHMNKRSAQRTNLALCLDSNVGPSCSSWLFLETSKTKHLKRKSLWRTRFWEYVLGLGFDSSRWTCHPLAWCMLASADLAAAARADAGIFENVQGMMHVRSGHDRSALSTLQSHLTSLGYYHDYVLLCSSMFAPVVRKRTVVKQSLSVIE